jgi:uncharacterized integral membrane protein
MLAVRVLQYLLKFIAVVIIVGFVVLNRHEVEILYSPVSNVLTMPFWLLGLLLFSFGFVTGVLLLWLDSYRYKKELKQTKQKLNEAENDREALSETLHENQMQILEKKDI